MDPIYQVHFADKRFYHVSFKGCEEALEYARVLGCTLLSTPRYDRYLPIKVIKVETGPQNPRSTVLAIWTRQTLNLC